MTAVFAKEFLGRTDQVFSYEDHRTTLQLLVRSAHDGLAPFQGAITNFFSLRPDSATTLPPGFDRLPAIQWKRRNLETLRDQNPVKFEDQIKHIIHFFKTMRPTNEQRPS